MIFEEVINTLGTTLVINNRYQYTYIQGKNEVTKIGTLVSIKPRFLVFQLEDYKDTINVSDILNGDVKIFILDNEENLDIAGFTQSNRIEDESMTKDQIKDQIENDLQDSHNSQEENTQNYTEGKPTKAKGQLQMANPPAYDELLKVYDKYRSFGKVGEYFGVSAYVATTWLIGAGITESQDKRFKNIPRPKDKQPIYPERKVKQLENNKIPTQSIQQEGKEETTRTDKVENISSQLSINTLMAMCEDNKLIPPELSNILASSDSSIWEKIFLTLIGVLLIKNAFEK